MKLITYILILFTISLNAQMVRIIPDSIVDTSDFVESGSYQVYMDSVLVSAHFKHIKAAIKAGNLQKQFPTSKIEVVYPTGRPTGKFEIYIDQSKLNTNVNLDSVYGLINHLKATIAFQAQAINDLYIIELPKRDAKIAYIDSVNRIKYNILQKRIDALTPYDPNLLADVGIIDTSWTSNNEIYTYDGNNNYKYIHWELKENLKIDSTYKVSFDIELLSTDSALVDFWAYSDPESNPNAYLVPTVVTGKYLQSGSYEFEFTVRLRERNKFGIRARNNNATSQTNPRSFRMKNLKVLKL